MSTKFPVRGDEMDKYRRQLGQGYEYLYHILFVTHFSYLSIDSRFIRIKSSLGFIMGRGMGLLPMTTEVPLCGALALTDMLNWATQNLLAPRVLSKTL